MFVYEEIIYEKYNNQVFNCVLKNGSEIRLVLHEDYDKDGNISFNLYNYDDYKDCFVYTSKFISRIKDIVPEDTLIMEQSDDDFESEQGISKETYIKLGEYKVGTDLYKWNTPNELRLIYSLLKNPSISNSENYNDLESMIKHEYGLIYTWGYWDDFDDYSLQYCAVFSGAREGI